MTSTNEISSQPTGLDFLTDDVGENPLRFKLGQFGEDAWLGSRGECHGAVNDVSANNGTQPEHFLVWFLVHRLKREGVSLA